MVVASNYQGIPEALLDGALGYLAEPSDTVSWVENIRLALDLNSKERKELIEKGLKYLKMNYLGRIF